MTFTLSNHCSNNVVKFQWPNSGMDDMVFSPSVGHLHPKRSKDIVVTFKPSKPQVITAQKAFGRACRISFSQPISQVHKMLHVSLSLTYPRVNKVPSPVI